MMTMVDQELKNGKVLAAPPKRTARRATTGSDDRVKRVVSDDKPGRRVTEINPERLRKVESSPNKLAASPRTPRRTDERLAKKPPSSSVSKKESGEKPLARKPSSSLAKKPSKSTGAVKTAATGAKRPSSRLGDKAKKALDENVTPEEKEKRQAEKKRKAEARKSKSAGKKADKVDANGKKKKKKVDLKKAKELEEKERKKAEKKKAKEELEKESKALQAMKQMNISPAVGAMTIKPYLASIFKPAGEILELHSVVDGDKEIEIEDAADNESKAEQFELPKRQPTALIELQKNLPSVSTDDVTVLKAQLQIKEREFFCLMNRITEYAQNLNIIVARLEA